MTTVYGDQRREPSSIVVDTVGTQTGPPGGDAWSMVARLPRELLQSNRHYAFFVTCKVGNFQWSGTTPVHAQVQLCLGDTFGVKHIDFLTQISLNQGVAMGSREALPVHFLVIFSASPIIPDRLWGAVWSNRYDLCLWGRVHRVGDPATYTASFEVFDLVWTWFDLDAIPSSDQLAALYQPASPVAIGAAPSWTDLWFGGNTPGLPGEKWLHLCSVYYDVLPGTVPTWQPGVCTSLAFSSFAARLAKNGTHFGFTKRGSSTAAHDHYQHGGFWVEDQPNNVFVHALRARDAAVGAGGASRLRRFAVLSIRLDDLPDVQTQQSDVESALSDDLALTFQSRYYPMEVQHPARVSNPWIWVCGALELTTALRLAYDWWVDTDLGKLPWIAQAFTSVVGPHEGAPCVGFGSNGIGPNAQDVQYRFRMLGVQATVTHLDVRDITVLQWWPVKDPSYLPAVDPLIAGQIEVVPGREALGVASLPDPPFTPNAELVEGGVHERPSIRGVTGYRRSWNAFVRPRGTYQFRWGPLSKADAETMLAWLAANLTFRATPTRGSLSPFAILSQPAITPIDQLQWMVTVDAALLVFTGP